MGFADLDLELKGRKVLITGASRGIGAEVARRFASEGCDIVIVSRTAEDLEKVAAEIRASAGNTVAIEAVDLSIGANVVALAQRHADVDILVNSAGALPGGHLLDIDAQTWSYGPRTDGLRQEGAP